MNIINPLSSYYCVSEECYSLSLAQAGLTRSPLPKNRRLRRIRCRRGCGDHRAFVTGKRSPGQLAFSRGRVFEGTGMCEEVR